MNDINKIIGMRDTNSEMGEKFKNLIDSRQDIPELEQIKNGYNNILLVSSILRCRAESLLALIN